MHSGAPAEFSDGLMLLQTFQSYGEAGFEAKHLARQLRQDVFVGRLSNGRWGVFGTAFAHAVVSTEDISFLEDDLSYVERLRADYEEEILTDFRDELTELQEARERSDEEGRYYSDDDPE